MDAFLYSLIIPTGFLIGRNIDNKRVAYHYDIFILCLVMTIYIFTFIYKSIVLSESSIIETVVVSFLVGYYFTHVKLDKKE